MSHTNSDIRGPGNADIWRTIILEGTISWLLIG